jgi:hypothetical protein
MTGREKHHTSMVGRDPVLNLPVCNCLEFMADGKSIVSGWSDGHIRSFLPQTGRLSYLIKEAHQPMHLILKGAPNHDLSKEQPKGVTCCNTSMDCYLVLTGGSDGEVHLYQIGKQTQKNVATQRVHKAPVTAVRFIMNDAMVCSSSTDGTMTLFNITKDLRLEPTHTFSNPATLTQHKDILISGIL